MQACRVSLRPGKSQRSLGSAHSKHNGMMPTRVLNVYWVETIRSVRSGIVSTTNGRDLVKTKKEWPRKSLLSDENSQLQNSER
jgi:hypothetical protein